VNTTGASSKTRAYPERGKVLAGLVLAMGLAAMDTTIVATAVPSIVRDLGGFSLFTWAFSAYLLTQAVTVPIYGKLADLHGRKPVLIVGSAIFLFGSALCGLSWSMPALIAFRAIQGIGAGAVQPIVTTVAGDMYTLEERARVQGWLSSVWGISAIVGPVVGGFFTEYASWRWIFYVNVPLGAVALFMIGTYLHENVERRTHSVDYAGAVLLATGVGLLMVGLLEGGTGWTWLSASSLLTFGASAVVLLAFVWQERRADRATVDVREAAPDHREPRNRRPGATDHRSLHVPTDLRSGCPRRQRDRRRVRPRRHVDRLACRLNILRQGLSGHRLPQRCAHRSPGMPSFRDIL
jgi:multidrug resistance protein